MDKEQAIEKLNDIRCHVKETSAEEQALVMAIDALKQPVATDTNVGDKISRQAAIRWVKTECNPYGKPTIEFESGKRVMKHLEQMPPAQPETKKGKWIRNDNGTYSCSVCHSWIPEEQHHYARYCLYCGADMRGEKDE